MEELIRTHTLTDIEYARTNEGMHARELAPTHSVIQDDKNTRLFRQGRIVSRTLYANVASHKRKFFLPKLLKAGGDEPRTITVDETVDAKHHNAVMIKMMMMTPTTALGCCGSSGGGGW